MDGITVSPAELKATAARIAQTNQQLDAALNKIKSDMSSLVASWQSQGGNTTQQVFSVHAAKFPEYRDYIQNYSKFLEATSVAYDKAEETINKGASSFGG